MLSLGKQCDLLLCSHHTEIRQHWRVWAALKGQSSALDKVVLLTSVLWGRWRLRSQSLLIAKLRQKTGRIYMQSHGRFISLHCTRILTTLLAAFLESSGSCYCLYYLCFIYIKNWCLWVVFLLKLMDVGWAIISCVAPLRLGTEN